MLDQRLLACAAYVRPNAKVVDIGTDHAYLPCYLVQSGVTRTVLAADVNEKPLSMARKTIAQYGLSGVIQTVLSDGLAQIDASQADDVIVAGMGGELIARIVLDCPWLCDSEKHLILQPMSQAPFLRRTLYAHGFGIRSETPVFENGHHYTILLCTYTGVAQTVDDFFALTGKLPEQHTPEAKAHLRFQQERMQKIAGGLRRAKDSAEQAAFYTALAEQIGRLF